MNSIFVGLVAVLLAAIVGWGLPALGMRALVPVLESSGPTASNYRGRRVLLGLGVVWVVWVAAMLCASVVVALADTFMRADQAGAVGIGARMTPLEELLFYLSGHPFGLWFQVVPFVLVCATFSFGIVDDVFGGRDKGFAGHLSALVRGRLTTGGLKMLGIGVVAAYYAAFAAERLATSENVRAPVLTAAAAWVLATLVIALLANLMNLLDLRPGRALKAYVVLVLPAAAALIAHAVRAYTEIYSPLTADGFPAISDADSVLAFLALAVALIGPVLAVWHYDLGERGMLGDAGSNVMGVVVGYLLVNALSLVGLAIVAGLLLALNLASEFVSFSRIIEGCPPLRWLDGLGRLKEGAVAGSSDEDPSA